MDNPELDYLEPAGWFPDGKSVLVSVEKPDKTWQLARISIADGSVKIIKSLGWRFQPGGGRRPALSPDGRYIAYPALANNPAKAPPAPPDSTDQHIYILPSDGSNPETEIAKGASINESPIWTPDGAHLLFVSNMAGNLSLWSVAVQDGKPAAAMSPLRSGIGRMLAIGMTRSGSYYYAERRDRVDQIVVAKIDPSTAKPQESIRPMDTFIGRKAAWSPDGKYIAFLRARPRDSGLLADQYGVVVRSLETGEEQMFSRDGFTDLGDPYPLLWFHDSKSFLTVFHDRPNSAVVLYRVDLATREWKEILTVDTSMLTSVKAISPDDKTIYFGASNSRPSINATPLNYVVALDLNSRQQKRLFTIPGSGASQFALSPDGRTLAMLGVPDATTKDARLSRISVDGSNYLELPAFSHIEGQLWPRKLAWTPDGRTILFARQDERGKWQIMRLPADGRTAAESTGLEGADYLGTLDLSSDGSHIAFDAITKDSTELWVLDNVPSLLKASR